MQLCSHGISRHCKGGGFIHPPTRNRVYMGWNIIIETWRRDLLQSTRHFDAHCHVQAAINDRCCCCFGSGREAFTYVLPPTYRR